MNWRAFIYPLFHGYPRVIIKDRAHMRYEEHNRFVPFEGEALQDGFAISTSTLTHWHSSEGTVPLSLQEKTDVTAKVAAELESLGYKVFLDADN